MGNHWDVSQCPSHRPATGSALTGSRQDPAGASPGVWVKEGTSPSAIDKLLHLLLVSGLYGICQCPAEFSRCSPGPGTISKVRVVGSHLQLAVTVNCGRLVQAYGLCWHPVTLPYLFLLSVPFSK